MAYQATIYRFKRSLDWIPATINGPGVQKSHRDSILKGLHDEKIHMVDFGPNVVALHLHDDCYWVDEDKQFPPITANANERLANLFAQALGNALSSKLKVVIKEYNDPDDHPTWYFYDYDALDEFVYLHDEWIFCNTADVEEDDGLNWMREGHRNGTLALTEEECDMAGLPLSEFVQNI